MDPRQPIPEDETGIAPKDDSASRVPYVSISDLVHQIHQLGSSTRNIVPNETIIRVNQLQSKVEGFSNSLTDEEWNELMDLKTEATKLMQSWIDEKQTVEEKMPYISCTDIVNQVHHRGGHTSKILPNGLLDKVNNYQKRTNRREELPTAEWNDFMSAKQQIMEVLQAWLATQDSEQ